jgi:hypothetical protein
MHIKDLELLNALKRFFGVGNVRTSGKFAYFEVAAKTDLFVIIQHLKLFPLQTSKRHSFYIFMVIFGMYLNQEHFNKEGLMKMLSYANFLNKPLRAETMEYVVNKLGGLPFLALPPVPVLQSIILPSPWWIVGFVVGEGCFSYSKVARTINSTNENRLFYYFDMSINQLKFDKYILNSISNYLGWGAIYEYLDKSTASISIIGLERIQHII